MMFVNMSLFSTDKFIIKSSSRTGIGMPMPTYREVPYFSKTAGLINSVLICFKFPITASVAAGEKGIPISDLGTSFKTEFPAGHVANGAARKILVPMPMVLRYGSFSKGSVLRK